MLSNSEHQREICFRKHSLSRPRGGKGKRGFRGQYGQHSEVYVQLLPGLSVQVADDRNEQCVAACYLM